MVGNTREMDHGGSFASDLCAKTRRATYGEAVGQSGWLTPRGHDLFVEWLAMGRASRLFNAVLVMIAATALVACSVSDDQRSSVEQGIEPYLFLVGSWEGELEYLDYGDDLTLVRLPTSLTSEPGPDSTSLELAFSYVEPSGRVESSDERLAVTPEGVRLGDLWQVREPAQEVSPGIFEVVLEREGEDNGQPAVIVNAIRLEADELLITSTVTYNASGETLQRHQYRLRRAGPEREDD